MQVTIRRCFNLIEVSPVSRCGDLPRRLEFDEKKFLRGQQAAIWRWREAQQGRVAASNLQLIRTKLYRYHPDGDRLIAPHGLTSRVMSYLKSINIPYVYQDDDPIVLPDPDYTQLGSLRDAGQMQSLIAIVTHDHGIINLPTAYGKSTMIGELISIWPTVPFLIVAPGVQVARTLVDYLIKRKPLDVGLVGDGQFDIRRVTVCTIQSLLRLEEKLNDFRVLIYDEVYTAAAPSAAAAICRVRRARMYGLAASPFSRDDGRNLVTEALFGPIIYSMTYQAGVDVGAISPIVVLVVSTDHASPGAISSPSIVVQKRHCYWRNERRNHRIAESVALAAQHLNKPVDDLQILITCETLEHALELKRVCPDFVVCHSGGVDKSRAKKLEKRGLDATSLGLTQEHLVRLRKEFEDGTLKHVIATPVWRSGVNFRKLSVEIRADGVVSTTDNVQKPGRLSRLHDDKQFGLLVDFTDGFSEWAAARTRKRLAVYRRHGWKIIHL